MTLNIFVVEGGVLVFAEYEICMQYYISSFIYVLEKTYLSCETCVLFIEQ